MNWGFLERQQQPPLNQEAAELPATEGTQPAVEDEDPVPSYPEDQVFDEESGLCVFEDYPEGQVLDEETGFWVMEEQEEAIEEEPQCDDEKQTTDQGDSSEDGIAH